MNPSFQSFVRGFYYLTEADALGLPSLDLHAKIDRIERNARLLERGIAGTTGLLETIFAKLDGFSESQRIDDSGAIDEFLRPCEQILRSQSIPGLEKLLRESKELTGIDPEYLTSIFHSFEMALQHTHEQLRLLQELKWKILEHDADLETPNPEKFESVEELLAALKA